MATQVDKDSIVAAYEDIRDDSTDTTWAVIKFAENELLVDSTGTDYNEFQSKFTDDERAFGFVRMITGDEMSRRAKFALITWCGSGVAALKRAKMSTDKTLVKNIIQNFAVEIQSSEQDELSEEAVRKELIRAGGANYGTGARD